MTDIALSPLAAALDRIATAHGLDKLIRALAEVVEHRYPIAADDFVNTAVDLADFTRIAGGADQKGR